MAISVNWITGEISIPQADLTFIGGTLYELDMDVFRLALKDLEYSEEGMPWPRTHDHVTEIVQAGVTYSRFVTILAPYFITFENGLYRVNLVGANTNVTDVLTLNGVQVIPSNSAGLQKVNTGTGLDPSESAQLADVYHIIKGKNVINRTTGEMEVYNADTGVLLYTAPIYEDAAATTPVGPNSVRIDRRNRMN